MENAHRISVYSPHLPFPSRAASSLSVMASILHLFASLSLILSFVIQNLASLNSLTAASTRACSTLVSSLGSKVINSTSDPKEYDYSRTHYWSDLNKHDHPVCVVLAESAQDVQAAVKAVRKHGSRFAVKAGATP